MLFIEITQPPDQASLKGTSIRLPKFGINVSGGNKFKPCDRSLPVEKCGAGSILGNVVAYSPLVPYALGGNLYLRSPDANGNLGITIFIKGNVGKGKIEVKAEGRLEIDAAAGTLTTVVDEGQIATLTIGAMAIAGRPDAELSVDLSTRRTKRYTDLDAEYKLKDPQKLRAFKLRFGSSRKCSLKASTKRQRSKKK